MSSGKSGAIRAGRAFVEAFLDDSALRRGMTNVMRRMHAMAASLRQFGRQAMVVGLAIAAPLLASAAAFSKIGDEIHKASIRTGVMAESLSTLGFAAQQSGSDLKAVEAGIRGMNRNLLELQAGSGTAVDTFGKLGLTWSDLESLSPEDRFVLISDRLSQISDEGLRSATAMRVFGKSGTELLPMLEGGAAGIRELQDEARRLGLVFSTEDAKAAAELSDAFGRLRSQAKSLTLAIGGGLAPVLTKIADSIKAPVAAAVQWAKENPGLVVTIAKVSAAVLGLSAAMFALSGVFTLVGFGMKILLAGIAAVGLAVSALLSPLGLLAGAVAIFATKTEAGSKLAGQAVSWLGEKFGPLRKDAVTAFDSISESLRNGNIGAAAKVAWAFIKLEFTRGVSWLREIWADWKNFFQTAWALAVSNASAAAVRFWYGLQVGAIETVDFFRDAWSSFFAWMEKRWIDLKSFFDVGLGDEKQAMLDDMKTQLAEKRGTMAPEQVAAYEKAIAMAEKELGPSTSDQKADVDAERDKTVFARMQARETFESRIGEEADRTLAALDEKLQGDLLGLDQNKRDSISASERDLADAVREFQSAVDSAQAAANPAAQAQSAALALGSIGSGISGVSPLSAGLAREAGKQSTASTFNAFAISGLGDNPARETAKATKESAKYLKKIAEKEDLSGFVEFG